VNYPEVWACPKLLAKKIESELSKSLGCPQLLAKKIKSELCKSLGAYNIWQKKYKVKYQEDWACLQLLVKEL